ncbi:MAG: SpoIIE family protein phosphatase [Chitinivibrionales bacterium]|nr:SpoIIE family protein phosphatase [Chitinivibrionales bacterium]
MTEPATYSNPDKELSIARSIQAAMVPHYLPSAEGIDIASLYKPCDAVGGDLFDVIKISEDELGFLLFDVSGSGVSSALISSMGKVAFMSHLKDFSSPRTVLERVNRELVRHIDVDYFITAFLAHLDLHNNKLTYCNAGHTYPVVYSSKDDALIPLKTSGLFVGIFDDGLYDEKSIFLDPGDWLILFSNGLYGMYNPQNELEGRRAFERHLQALVKQHSPGTLMQEIDKYYTGSAHNVHIEDDINIIAVEMLTQSRKDKIKQQLGFDGSEPVYLQFINYFEDMDKTSAVILRSMDDLGYADDTIRKMKISLTELLANAIYHGNKKDHNKKVTIGHLVNKSYVKVSIMDEGEGFDIASVPDPTLPENLERDCGRGLYIVRNYVDKVELNDRGNRISIVKHHFAEE